MLPEAAERHRHAGFVVPESEPDTEKLPWEKCNVGAKEQAVCSLLHFCPLILFGGHCVPRCASGSYCRENLVMKQAERSFAYASHRKSTAAVSGDAETTAIDDTLEFVGVVERGAYFPSHQGIFEIYLNRAELEEAVQHFRDRANEENT